MGRKPTLILLIKLTCLFLHVNGRPEWPNFSTNLNGEGVTNVLNGRDGHGGGRHPKDTSGLYRGESHFHAHHAHPAPAVQEPGAAEASQIKTPTGVAPHCQCVVRGTGCLGREAYTRQFDGISTLSCGHQFERCCFEDPWPGLVDRDGDVLPCAPQESCTRYYGQEPTDIRDYGTLGPCPGAGSVRCIPGKQVVFAGEGLIPLPPKTETIVVPIIHRPPTPPTPPPVPVPPPTPTPVPVVPVETTTTPVPEETTTTTEAPVQPPTTLPPVVLPPPPPTTTPLPPLYDIPPPPVDELPTTTTTTTTTTTPSPAYEPPVPTDTYEPPTTTTETTVPVQPSPPHSRPGPPYLWSNLNNIYRGYYPGYGYGFRAGLRKSFGFFI